jgi:hypothetical protein
MSFDVQKLYEMLPAVYRSRDEAQGGPLKALLTAIAGLPATAGGEATAGQIAVLEENLAQLYDDQFIETCAEWVVPYIGDLVGTRGLHAKAPKVASPRAEVANTIAYRRRKGTASMLEQLARDVTGWDARAVEFFKSLGTAQFMNHVRLDNRYSPDLRDWTSIERLNTPFDTVSHTVDVRRIATSGGRYNIPNIGIFLWRLMAERLANVTAAKVDNQRFLFNPLGCNTQLFTRPEAEDSITHLADPIDVPMPISRRVFAANLAAYYGAEKSIFLPDQLTSNVVVCNLADSSSGWGNSPPKAGIVAVDPELGRIAFGDAQLQPPRVTFHTAFSAALGGGDYARADSFEPNLQPFQQLASPATIQTALNGLTAGGVLQINDSATYPETPVVQLGQQAMLELRSADGERPVISLTGDLSINGDAGSVLIINGLVVTGGILRIPAATQLRRLRLVHCTLVPGLGLNGDGTPKQPTQPSVIVEAENVAVEIDQSIVGGVRVSESSSAKISNSLVDATSAAGVAFAGPSLASPVSRPQTGGVLSVSNCTIIGKISTRLLDQASNSIFLARLLDNTDQWPAAVWSAQRQAGCVRFCWLPIAAQVPSRYHCQPDWEISQQIATAERAASAKNQTLSQTELAAIGQDVRTWLVPTFTSAHFGDPAYGQLDPGCPVQIRTGADDESEMGVFHDIFQPQRETNLRVRLAEYLRFGLEAGLFYAT